MPFSDTALARARDLVDLASRNGLTVATAESCTGGLISGCITAVPGSSDIFRTGFVTYSNEAKSALLGVDQNMFPTAGAVSEPVARAMAEGALDRADADLAVSATGIAGPGGGSETKPVGLVHMAAARRGRPTLHHVAVYPGNRDEIRMAAVEAALGLLLEQMTGDGTATA